MARQQASTNSTQLQPSGKNVPSPCGRGLGAPDQPTGHIWMSDLRLTSYQSHLVVPDLVAGGLAQAAMDRPTEITWRVINKALSRFCCNIFVPNIILFGLFHYVLL